MEASAVRDDRCWRCGDQPGVALTCEACEAPQPLPAGIDHFGVLGVARTLTQDPAELERRYHARSRRLHPDRHQTAGARALELSVTASAALNRAYRTLRDSVARGRYWLELHGSPLGESNNRVPPALAAEVFEVQEQLADLRGGDGDRAAVAQTRTDVAARIEERVNDLEAAYRQGPEAATARALADLKERLSEIAYLRTLLRDVDRALEA